MSSYLVSKSFYLGFSLLLLSGRFMYQVSIVMTDDSILLFSSRLTTDLSIKIIDAISFWLLLFFHHLSCMCDLNRAY